MPSLNPQNPDARKLVRAMTESAALPAFVQRINPNTLKHLVEDVGLEDAGALIAHVSNQQLVHLLFHFVAQHQGDVHRGEIIRRAQRQGAAALQARPGRLSRATS